MTGKENNDKEKKINARINWEITTYGKLLK